MHHTLWDSHTRQTERHTNNAKTSTGTRHTHTQRGMHAASDGMTRERKRGAEGRQRRKQRERKRGEREHPRLSAVEESKREDACLALSLSGEERLTRRRHAIGGDDGGGPAVLSSLSLPRYCCCCVAAEADPTLRLPLPVVASRERERGDACREKGASALESLETGNPFPHSLTPLFSPFCSLISVCLSGLDPCLLPSLPFSLLSPLISRCLTACLTQTDARFVCRQVPSLRPSVCLRLRS